MYKQYYQPDLHKSILIYIACCRFRSTTLRVSGLGTHTFAQEPYIWIFFLCYARLSAYRKHSIYIVSWHLCIIILFFRHSEKHMYQRHTLLFYSYMQTLCEVCNMMYVIDMSYGNMRICFYVSLKAPCKWHLRLFDNVIHFGASDIDLLW